MDLSFLDRGDVTDEFQDLIDLGEADTANAGNVVADCTDAEVQIRRLDASTLTLTDIVAELERRGIQPRGFYSDDSRKLQRIYDDEHEEYQLIKRKELRDASIAEAKRKRERHRKSMIEEAIMEERESIASDKRLSEWFGLILAKSSPLKCRININNVTCRALSKALWLDDRIVAIDVSNMQLNDKAGAYLARALKNNRTLAKLEMDANNFQCETCKSLSNSLMVNKTLQYLSIGSNPLTKGPGGEGEGYVELLARAIRKNTGLICLSIWRCGIGLEGGKVICKAVSNISSLISVEVGYNNFDNNSILLMNDQLEANRRDRELRLAQEAEVAAEREKALLEKQWAERERQKQDQDRLWLEEQKAARADARRLELDRQHQEKRKEDENRRQLEHAQKLEEERTAAASKKKKKGKKGKKDKKKK